MKIGLVGLNGVDRRPCCARWRAWSKPIAGAITLRRGAQVAYLLAQEYSGETDAACWMSCWPRAPTSWAQDGVCRRRDAHGRSMWRRMCARLSDVLAELAPAGAYTAMGRRRSAARRAPLRELELDEEQWQLPMELLAAASASWWA